MNQTGKFKELITRIHMIPTPWELFEEPEKSVIELYQELRIKFDAYIVVCMNRLYPPIETDPKKQPPKQTPLKSDP